jgi:hypothetical protein
MSKKVVFFCMGVLFFSSCHLAHASLSINEIMYDLKTGSDDGREWIEIYNDADAPVDLSSLRLFEADTSHKIKLVEGDAKVAAKGYAVIVSDPAKFKTDWPNLFSGSAVSIFDSSFSLNNDGELLMLQDGNKDDPRIMINIPIDLRPAAQGMEILCRK